jgi:predicted N-acetyltransferase YhbS
MDLLTCLIERVDSMLKARTAEESDYEETLEMTQEAFRKESGGQSTGELERNIVEATVTGDPNFRTGDLRIVEARGKVVSMMLIVRREARIGKAIVSNAIVAPVATRAGCEKKGYCSAVMRDAVEYMKQQGFDITTLWGHPWLYTHYGYSPAMVGPGVAIRPERCEQVEVKEGFAAQPYEETQARAITDIYHSNTINQVLATIRRPEPYEWKVHSPSVEFWTLIDRRGRVRGYYSISQTASPGRNMLEIGVADIESCGVIFNELLDYAKERNISEMTCLMGPTHPFARFAYWRNAELRRTMASGAGMALILNLAGLFDKLKGELQDRLNHSEFYDKTLSLVIQTEKEAVNLTIDKGKIAFSTDEERGDYSLEAPLASLNQLLIGYKNVRRLLEENAVKIRSNKIDTIDLVDALFPENTPYDYHLPLVWE